MPVGIRCRRRRVIYNLNVNDERCSLTRLTRYKRRQREKTRAGLGTQRVLCYRKTYVKDGSMSFDRIPDETSNRPQLSNKINTKLYSLFYTRIVQSTDIRGVLSVGDFPCHVIHVNVPSPLS